MGPRPQCYIPSHKVIGPLALEKKIFEGFLPYMGVAAILVMWPRPREHTVVPPSHWGSIWNLALICPAVLRKTFWRWWTDGQWMDDGPWLYYKLTIEPKGSGELKTHSSWSEQASYLGKPCHYRIQATLVISTPDKWILLLISKWNLRPNIFLYTFIVFQLWISQSMNNSKLWISQSGFTAPK